MVPGRTLQDLGLGVQRLGFTDSFFRGESSGLRGLAFYSNALRILMRVAVGGRTPRVGTYHSDGGKDGKLRV